MTNALASFAPRIPYKARVDLFPGQDLKKLMPLEAPRQFFSLRPPTYKQMLVLRAIDEYTKAHKNPPTFRRLTAWHGLRSVHTIVEHVWSLERKGLVEQTRVAFEDDDGVIHGTRAKWGTMRLTHLGHKALECFDPVHPRLILPRG